MDVQVSEKTKHMIVIVGMIVFAIVAISIIIINYYYPSSNIATICMCTLIAFFIIILTIFGRPVSGYYPISTQSYYPQPPLFSFNFR